MLKNHTQSPSLKFLLSSLKSTPLFFCGYWLLLGSPDFPAPVAGWLPDSSVYPEYYSESSGSGFLSASFTVATASGFLSI